MVPRRGPVGLSLAAARSLRRGQLDRVEAPRRREGVDVRSQDREAIAERACPSPSSPTPSSSTARARSPWTARRWWWRASVSRTSSARARWGRCGARWRPSISTGRTLMPGLTDAHVHVCAVEGNTAEQHRHNPPQPHRGQGAPAHGAGARCRASPPCATRAAPTMASARPLESGLVPGAAHARLRPRALADRRPRRQAAARRSLTEPVDCCVGMVGVIADGPDEVRKAVREQLRQRRRPDQDHGLGRRHVARRRARHHPVHGGRDARGGRGGARGRQIRARPTPTPAPRCARPSRPGVRCIEHGNLIDATRREGDQEGGRLPRADHGHLRGDLARGQELRHHRAPARRRSTWRASEPWRG